MGSIYTRINTSHTDLLFSFAFFRMKTGGRFNSETYQFDHLQFLTFHRKDVVVTATTSSSRLFSFSLKDIKTVQYRGNTPLHQYQVDIQ